MQKISLFHQFILEIEPILESHDKSSHAHFWPCTPKNISTNFLIFMSLYQYAKNQAIALISSGDMADVKIVQSDWLRAF